MVNALTLLSLVVGKFVPKIAKWFGKKKKRQHVLDFLLAMLEEIADAEQSNDDNTDKFSRLAQFIDEDDMLPGRLSTSERNFLIEAGLQAVRAQNEGFSQGDVVKAQLLLLTALELSDVDRKGLTEGLTGLFREDD